MATMAQTRGVAWDWDRYAPLAGVLAVIGWVVGTGMLEVAGGKDKASELLTAYTKHDGRILFGGIIWLIATSLFVWVLGSLRSRLYAAEGGDGRLTALAYGSGIATAVCLALTPGAHMAAALSNDDLDRSAALALGNVGDAFFLGAEYLAPVLLIASAIVALRYGAFPKWLAWIQVFIAVVMLIAPIGWAALVFAFPLWVALVAVLLWRTPVVGPRPTV
jgi:hypothetical protein